jgi:hypothetical protein
VLAAIRRDARRDFVKKFDPAAETLPDHPLWTRFKALTGDTRASRELFARVIKNPEWLRRLDAAEIGPEQAARQYSQVMSEVDRAFWEKLRANKRGSHSDTSALPCDLADQAVYLLFLGTFPGTEKVKEDNTTLAERRLLYARGVSYGLQGKEFVPDQKSTDEKTTALAPGSDRVFVKLLVTWLACRSDLSTLDTGFECAVRNRVPEVLPQARAVAANEAQDRGTRSAALSVIAQFGDRADLPLFEAFFNDTAPFSVGRSNLDKIEYVVEFRDAAVVLALILCDRNPEDFGFGVPGDESRRENGRRVVLEYEWFGFAFTNDASRIIAHEQAREFLFKQKWINDQTAPRPRPKP